jgi:uncharacterized protein YjiS (DUF1127 family)
MTHEAVARFAADRRLFRRSTVMNLFSKSPSLLRELAEHDDRQLLDIGLVRGEDGSLRLATDPAQAITPPAPDPAAISLIGSITGFLREIPTIPLRTAVSSH